MATIGKNFSILLMEDEEDLGETLQEVLEDEGYRVHWVKDGLEAADVSFEQKFDLYIFDINVPELNGLELLKSLRHTQDATPTIFISAMIDIETMRKAFNIGAEDYLKKPFFPEELLLRIESKFQQKSSDIIYGNLHYNPEKKELKRDGEVLFLSKKQQQLFDVFIKNIGKTLEPHTIMEYASIKSLSALRVAINKLKQLTGIEIRSQHGVGIGLKQVEVESFRKSFLLFFISLSTLLGVVFYVDYQKELQSFDEKLLYKMHTCSYTLNCKEYKIDFDKDQGRVCYVLFKNEKEVFSYYPIKSATDFCLKLSLTQSEYHAQMHYLHENLILRSIVAFIVTLILSILFSFYALYPLRNALLLTREFVKDILHDFNTPIATMRLNISLLHKELGENKKLGRIERGIENILLLQENLKNYLNTDKSKKEEFNLYELIEDRVHLLENAYQDLTYIIDIPKETILLIEKKPFIRIVDNILSNASKYNKAEGKVFITFDTSKKSLTIRDTGKGIKNPKRIFERFYKEHERGVGIGLHIVKKLCDELGIKVELETMLDEGTSFILYLM